MGDVDEKVQEAVGSAGDSKMNRRIGLPGVVSAQWNTPPVWFARVFG